MPETPEKFYPRNRKEWRDWLRKYHSKKKMVWVVKYKKHTKKPSISHKESMEEAICFGWIDTIVKKIDDERYVSCFVRRNENSRWSNSTLGHARKLIKEKRMSPAGLQAYKEGLKKPVIDLKLPRNPKIPEDLRKELSKNRKARENFDNFAPSYKRLYIYWIEKAKRKETREKRIREVLTRAEQNKKFLM